jgi:hypothetical protein
MVILGEWCASHRNGTSAGPIPVPEGPAIEARQFIAGLSPTSGARPGGTIEIGASRMADASSLCTAAFRRPYGMRTGFLD